MLHRLFRRLLPGLTLAMLCVLLGQAADRPNFIVLIADDISFNDLGCTGSLDSRTPRIDALAREGLRFSNAILTASSCSPSRSSIITGRYPHNNGDAAELHRAISWHIPSLPGQLRDHGYYTALAGKHHMTWHEAPAGQTAPTEPFDKVYPPKVKGNSGGHGNWLPALHDCPADKPFFLWLAAFDAHRAWDGDREWDEATYGPKHDPALVRLPPALLDTPATREDFASYLNEVTRFDHFVGLIVDELKATGKFADTYLFVLADNGRPFPRAKTRLHDDGMRTYFIATGPQITRPGAVCDSLVSVIDIAPTVAELAGMEPARTFQGRSLIPAYRDAAAAIRPFAFSEHNWHDYEALGRSVRDGRFLYLSNDRPQFALQGPADSVSSTTFQDLLAAHKSGRLVTPIQEDVFRAPRPRVELYDTAGDPHQVHNLAGDPKLKEVESRLREALEFWREETRDSSPAKISRNYFDPETGDRLPIKRTDYQEPPPGADRNADHVNADGLR
jgi:N-sulfoglucosamine sulfohydrolase